MSWFFFGIKHILHFSTSFDSLNPSAVPLITLHLYLICYKVQADKASLAQFLSCLYSPFLPWLPSVVSHNVQILVMIEPKRSTFIFFRFPWENINTYFLLEVWGFNVVRVMSLYLLEYKIQKVSSLQQWPTCASKSALLLLLLLLLLWWLQYILLLLPRYGKYRANSRKPPRVVAMTR